MTNSISTISKDEEKIEIANKNDVGTSARKGIKWSVMQIIIRNAIALGTTASLARWLNPSDFGLIGMVAALTALMQPLSDMGLSWTTMQRHQLSKTQVSNLFWINFAVGVLLWVVCIVGAPAIANFYNNPKLINITYALGFGFVLNGVAAQPIALLNRKMKYKAASLIEVSAVVIGATAALVAALSNLTYWALVINTLISSFVRMLISIKLSEINISMPRSNAGTSALISFGGLLATNSMLIYFFRTIDGVLIGKYWGSIELGYYNRAYYLMLLPSMLATGVLTNLMVPTLAALKDDKKRFSQAYHKSIRMIALVGCPMALGLALTSSELVQLIYGEKWKPVVPILIWLSIASITEPIYNTIGWLFTVTGKIKPFIALSLFSGILLTLSFWIALPGGALGIAKAYGLVMGVIIFLPAMWLSHKITEVSIKETIKSVFPVLICLSLMSVSVIAIDHYLTTWGISWQFILIVKIIVGTATYTISSFVLMKSHILNEFKIISKSYKNKDQMLK